MAHFSYDRFAVVMACVFSSLISKHILEFHVMVVITCGNRSSKKPIMLKTSQGSPTGL